MKRGRNDHLDKLEREALRADICAGLTTPILVEKYNLTERNIQVYRSALIAQGLIAPTPRHFQARPNSGDRPATGANGPSIKRICFVSGCDRRVTTSNFCEAHEFKAPANMASLTRGRA